MLPSSKSDMSSIGMNNIIVKDGGVTLESELDDEGVSIDSSVQSFARFKLFHNFNLFGTLPPDKKLSLDSRKSSSLTSQITFGQNTRRHNSHSTATLGTEEEEVPNACPIWIQDSRILMLVELLCSRVASYF